MCDSLLKKTLKEIEEKNLPPSLSRNFCKISAVEWTSSTIPNEQIRIMQWNILAQALCQGDDNFIMCPEGALQWDVRKLRLVEEILHYLPDVLCMQEVDHFEYMNDVLQLAGYQGIFNPKPDSPCLYCLNSSGPDGCALFYRSERVHFVSCKNLGLRNKHGAITNQVAIQGVFETSGNKHFSVLVTHLKAKEGFEQLRLEQGEYILQYLKSNSVGIPTIVCGDFNGESSEPVYKLFESSKLDLFSAYTKMSLHGWEPPYTTWKIRGSRNKKVESCHTIDYIWMSRQGIQVTAVLDFPDEQQIGKNRLPNFSYCSDHFSLVCDFILC